MLTWTKFIPFRGILGTLVASALVVTTLVTGTSAQAEEELNAGVGSFGLGGDLSAGIDERTGVFSTRVPLVSLPGIAGSGGGFDLGISYRQSAADSSNDRFGLGSAWGWGITYIDTDAGIHVFPASGGAFEADASQPSGLSQYVQGDLLFSQRGGVLPARSDVNLQGLTGDVPYAYTLEYAGGVKDYFNAAGDLIVRMGLFGERVDLMWGSEHRLVAVADSAGSKMEMKWGESGVEIISPERHDHFVSSTVLAITGNNVVSITNPVDEKVTFTYDNDGLIKKIISGSGAVTDISYQHLPDKTSAVQEVRVTDSSTGTVLSSREWKNVGEHMYSGWPTYNNSNTLWGSGDGLYRYKTVLSDGSTDVFSEYNSLGLLLSRDLVVSTSHDDVTVRNQKFIYKGMESGGVPDPGALPKQYAKPVQASTVFSDSVGHTRTMTETSEYNDIGQITQHVSADGALTETVYDTHIPEGMELPVGLVVEETTTGSDGTVSKNVNTIADDHKSIRASETLVGTTSGELSSTTRTEFVVGGDGFMSEQRLIPTGSVSEGPDKVVTRFTHTVDRDDKTVTFKQIHAAGTDAQFTTSTVVDLPTGLPLSTTDPVGRVAKTSYDLAGRATNETGFTGLMTTTEYGNRFTRVTNSQGVTQTEYVDALGQVVKSTDNITTIDNTVTPVSGVERVVEKRKYEKNSSRVTSVDAQGLETVNVSDVYGRTVRSTAPNGVTQITNYDDVANTTTTGLVSDTNSDLSTALQVSTTRKDEQNHETSATQARKDGVRVPEKTVTYDGLGRVSKQVSGDLSQNVVLNADGTPQKTTTTPLKPDVFAGEPATAEREHNLMGTSTKKTLSQNGQKREGVSRVLDAAGQTVSETDQAGKTTIYEYTADGLVTTTHNGGSGTVTYNTYDPLTRALVLSETIASNGSVSQKGFEYDPQTGKTIAVFDPSDREATQMQYTYDVLGNVTSIHYPDGKIVTHVFDENNKHVSATDTVGNITVFSYNKYGFVEGATQTSPDSTVLAHVEYKYDDFGRMKQLSRGNGVTTTYTFTSANEIATEKTTNNGQLITDTAYTYDPHGNVTKRVETRPAGVEDDRPLTETTVYTYDAYDHLTGSAVYEGSDAVGESRLRTEYVLNVSGDVVKETTSSIDSSTQVREFEYTERGHLIGVTTQGNPAKQTYDDAGNLTATVDGTQYSYNVDNQLVAEVRADGTRVGYTYWATGNRHTVTTTTSAGSETVGMYWDGATLINDTHAQVTGSYLVGASRHSRTLVHNNDGVVEGSEYYVSDRHGNTTALTTDTGSTAAVYGYSDYGTPVSVSETETELPQNRFLYAGEYTTDSGTQFLGARVYDPTMMRFTTQDSAELQNLYAYGNGNPIMMVDPTGQTAARDYFLGGVGSALGLVVGLVGFAASLATGGLSAAGYAGFILTGLADVGSSGIQLTDIVLETEGIDFLSDRNSEIMMGVVLGLSVLVSGVIGGVSVASQYMTKNAPKSTEMGIATNFKEAIELYKDDANAMNSWRATFKKSGDLRDYYHGTSGEGVQSIVSGGFDYKAMEAIKGKKGNHAYGEGTYITSYKETARSYVNNQDPGMVKVAPNFWGKRVRKYANDLENPRMAWVEKNSFHSKTQNSKVDRFLNKTVTYSRGEPNAENDVTIYTTYRRNRDFYGPNPGGPEKDSVYVVIRNDTPEAGILPLNGLSVHERDAQGKW